MKQSKEGPVDEGVAKLKKSSKDHPENIPYRQDYLRERERALNSTLKEASLAFIQEDLTLAESLYQKVLNINPDSPEAKQGLLNIARKRRHIETIAIAREALQQSKFDKAREALRTVLLEDPKNNEANNLSAEIDATRFNGHSINTSPELKAIFKKPVSMQFRDANFKMVLEALSRSSGLNILIDKDIKNDLKTTIFAKDVTVEDVISLVLMQNQLEKKIINDSTIYIYPNTPAKVKEHQDLVVRTFLLTNADAKQMQTLLKTVLKANDIYVNDKNNSLVMRDTPDVIELAGKLLAAQDQNQPEVMLEVEVLEVDHNKLTQIGAQYPSSVSFSVGNLSTSAVTAGTNYTPASQGGTTLKSLQHLNASNINVLTSAGAISLVMDLKQQDGSSNLLASPRIRVKQDEKAKVHIGDKVPIITNSVTPVSTGTPVVTGNVQYLDVGIKLEVEPHIHMDGEISIKTSLEVSNIGAQVTNASSGSVAYQIGTRIANTVLRLNDGETQVLAGLINDQNIKSANRVPGLGDLPLIGHLFSDNTTNKSKTEIILSITPHIIRNQHQPDAGVSSYWSGTGSTVRSKPITLDTVDTLKVESTGGNLPANASMVNVPPLPEIAPPAALSDAVPVTAPTAGTPQLPADATSGDISQPKPQAIINSTPPVVFRPAASPNVNQIPLNPNSPAPVGGTGMGGAAVNKPAN
jgi:general secretion pathway protein D